MPTYPSKVHSKMPTFIGNVDDILPPSLQISKDKRIATRNVGTEIDDNFSKHKELDIGNWQKLYNQTYCSTVYDPILDFGPRNDDVSLIDAKTVKPKRNDHMTVLYFLAGILVILGFAVLIYTVFSLEISEIITVKLSALGSKSCPQDNIENKNGVIVLC